MGTTTAKTPATEATCYATTAGTTKGQEGRQEECAGGHDAFTTGRTVMKALLW